MKIQSITIDSSAAITTLCEFGAAHGTDKSPYNVNGHRHPYTAVYSLLLGRFRYQPCRFVEIGIAGGASVLMWRHYFKNENTKIFAFDRDENFIANVNQFRLLNVYGLLMDVTNESSIHQSLQQIGGNLDVILDDSTHGLTEQIKIIKASIPYLKPGGMIIIEDVFRRTPNEDYENALVDVFDEFSEVMFIVTEHTHKYSPGWDNDKLLVLIKK
jgi:predicted O-methyltransferase YrrM